MRYQNLSQCLDDLEATGRLVRISHPVDPDLEIGSIQRRVFAAKGPALLFENVRGTAFPMAANIFGSLERTRYIFRHSLMAVETIMAAGADPVALLKKPWRLVGLPPALLHALPKKVKTGPVLAHETTISALPQLKSWPMDGGAYVTLPQVYTEDPETPGPRRSNLGMYRVQLSGNDFKPDLEAGLHYQIHRGIGPHHAKALARGEALPVNVFIGGPPAMTMAAVMPLPDGLPELYFAGVLGGRRMELAPGPNNLPVAAQADFCICGRVRPGRAKPEGPFGDHLGYYSLAHDFPVMDIDAVYHRPGAVWPFTTVGRPPQEDTMFGTFIHELTTAMIPVVFPGVHEVHAVDAAGVHPLLLAVGSERYVPYADERIPQELLTNAMSLLGNTQTALSKYVIIAAREDDANLSAHDVPGFFRHLLERIDLTRDLHFVTRTTMDTLDYSGISLNQGSKAVIAAAGKPRRQLGTEAPASLPLPPGFSGPAFFAPGILVLSGPAHKRERDTQDPRLDELARALTGLAELDGFPLVVVADDAAFTAGNWNNFLWTTFTRSDPATDTYGGGQATNCKHWGCTGPLIVDARLKTYHAPPLAPDPKIEKRVDDLAAPGGPLHGLF